MDQTRREQPLLVNFTDDFQMSFSSPTDPAMLRLLGYSRIAGKAVARSMPEVATKESRGPKTAGIDDDSSDDRYLYECILE